MWRWLLRHSGEPVSRIPQPFFFSIRTSRYSQNMSIQLIFLMYFPNYVFPWSSYSSPFNWSVKHSLGMSTFSSGINLPCIHSKKKRKSTNPKLVHESKAKPRRPSSSFHMCRTKKRRRKVVHSREAKWFYLWNCKGCKITNSVLTLHSEQATFHAWRPRLSRRHLWLSHQTSGRSHQATGSQAKALPFSWAPDTA